jgi:hypothetical protein
MPRNRRRIGRPQRQNVDYGLRVQTGFSGNGEGFREGSDVGLDDEVVEQLEGMSCPSTAWSQDVGSERSQHGFDPFKHSVVGTNQHVERARFRVGRTKGERSVYECHVDLCATIGQSPSGFRFRC